MKRRTFFHHHGRAPVAADVVRQPEAAEGTVLETSVAEMIIADAASVTSARVSGWLRRSRGSLGGAEVKCLFVVVRS